MWIWLADHDLDYAGNPQFGAYSGRGILSESLGPVWMIGTGAYQNLDLRRFIHLLFFPFSDIRTFSW